MMSSIPRQIERAMETAIFASRWLLAPFYLGLALSLFVLLIKFMFELVHIAGTAFTATESQVILGLLALVDLALTGSLVIIVIFSGYENFVSKIDVGNHEDRPEWMGTVDFSGLKMKLIASIVAISAIALLKAFLQTAEPGHEVDVVRLQWLVFVHLTFVVSGVVLALMDYITSKTSKH